MDFDACFALLVDPKNEGGYVDNRNDPGGKTKYGISQASYPNLDIKNLTLADAKVIYLRDYWPACSNLPDYLRWPFFAMYVNTKPREAIKALQLAAGTYPDGVMGPNTLQAVNAAKPDRLLMRFSAAKNLYYTSCHDWPSFGRGWVARESRNILSLGALS